MQSPRKRKLELADESTDHRVPVSTRIRGSLISEIKREGLRRQLAGESVHTLQAILEQAALDWLRKNSTAS